MLIPDTGSVRLRCDAVRDLKVVDHGVCIVQMNAAALLAPRAVCDLRRLDAQRAVIHGDARRAGIRIGVAAAGIARVGAVVAVCDHRFTYGDRGAGCGVALPARPNAHAVVLHL